MNPTTPPRWPAPNDSTGNCRVCGRCIDFEVGVIIDDGNYPQVCRECWEKLTPDQKLSQAAKWLLLAKQTDCLEKIARLAEGAFDGYRMPRGDLGEAGRN